MAKLKHHIPERMEEIWDWIVCLDAWDSGEPDYLSEYILNEEIPEELKKPISDIISGRRKPNLKGKGKYKIEPLLRWYIGRIVIYERQAVEQEKARAAFSGEDGEAELREPIKVIRDLEAHMKGVISLFASAFKVSEKTIENSYETVTTKIKNWPVL